MAWFFTEADKNQRASIQKKAEKEAKQQAKPAKSDASKQRADTDQDTPTVPAKKASYSCNHYTCSNA